MNTAETTEDQGATRPTGAVARAMAVAACVALSACGGGSDSGFSFTPIAPVTSPPPAPPPAADGPMVRQTTAGKIEGVDDSAGTGTWSWKGVPFAQAPVGPLRWAPPADPKPWEGVRAASRFGRSCAQGGRYFSPAPGDAPFGLGNREGFGKPVGDEDCLTLNIWRPAGDTAKLPVIVYIYGGSNISGYTADPGYDGAQLAKRGNAVVVTINYRLGVLGWLDLPQLKTGEAKNDSGNFALLDQMQALKFVQANIGAFGGDAGNVTVMGQSAGAVNTWGLVVSSASAGLLHKAAPLSGGMAFASRATAQTYSKALLNAIAIAEGKATDTPSASAWVASQTDAQIATYLRGLPADRLLTIVLANPQLGNAPAPIEDGTILPVNSRAEVDAGRFNKVPMLIGNTRDEGTLFANLFGTFTGQGLGFKPTDYERFGLQYNFNPDAAVTLTEADLINAPYLPVDKPLNGWKAASDFATDAIFLNGLPAQIDSVAKYLPTKTWYYRFDWSQQVAPFNTVYGATHGLDTAFMFHNFGTSIFSFSFGEANRPGREALSDAMVGSLSAFARTGNPNHSGLGVTWPTWPRKLVLDASKTQLQNSAP
ncbi:para-nitrobenzyl esterase [Variovorax boronicumulans]|uniref:carboxylesterase/lipase family protein n=1 Tax=Variovorax boronicumulans TaxID=436515 RepID=UPI002475312A|nr:carboxylesterase family protein [Variovorax boronicumulans]MDH6169039.1 para-nitrobenzyl esterase [Variovorax boronicumulans]